MNLFEIGILDWLAEHLRCGFLDAVMPVITRFGDGGIFWIALAAVLLIIPKTRKIGLSMGLALLTGFLVGNVFLKNVVARVRPYDVKGGVELLIAAPTDWSFPSGHTLACFEGAVSITLRKRAWGVPALVLAALVAFSRLYLYVHYPTDVLAGAILGTAFAFLACFLVDKLYARLERNRGAEE